MNIPRPTRDLTSLTRPRCDLRHTGGLPAGLEVWTNIQVVPLIGKVRVNLHVDGFCYGGQIQRSGAEVSVSKTTSRGYANLAIVAEQAAEGGDPLDRTRGHLDAIARRGWWPQVAAPIRSLLVVVRAVLVDDH